MAPGFTLGLGALADACAGAPGVTRTPGQRFRKPLLYPSELQGPNATKSNALMLVPQSVTRSGAHRVELVRHERLDPPAGQRAPARQERQRDQKRACDHHAT